MRKSLQKSNSSIMASSRNRNALLMTKSRSNKITVCNISLMLQAPHFFLKTLTNSVQKCSCLSPHCEHLFPVFKCQDTSLHLTLDSTCLTQITFQTHSEWKASGSQPLLEISHVPLTFSLSDSFTLGLQCKAFHCGTTPILSNMFDGTKWIVTVWQVSEMNNGKSSYYIVYWNP